VMEGTDDAALEGTGLVCIRATRYTVQRLCENRRMPVSRPKRPRDANQLAWQIVQEATGQAPKQNPIELPEPHQAARAAALGGQARARALTPAKRKLVAKAAAAARWNRKK